MSEWDDLAVEVHDGSGPYALMVHGFLSSRSHWLANLEALRAVCRPVVVELYGHGDAATVDEPARLAPSGYGAAFDRIRCVLGQERWFVIGHSLGGALTVRYAIEHPGAVLAHVFTNSQSAFADDAWVASTVRQSAKLAVRLESPDGQAVLAKHPMHPRNSNRVPPHISSELVSDYARHDPIGVALQMRHTLPGSSVRSIAAMNSRPALLTTGTDERGFAETAAHIAVSMPMVEAVHFDAGHNVNIHQAEQWNEAVCTFLHRHSMTDD